MATRAVNRSPDASPATRGEGKRSLPAVIPPKLRALPLGVVAPDRIGSTQITGQ